MFCLDDPVTRGQMAVFLVAAPSPLTKIFLPLASLTGGTINLFCPSHPLLGTNGDLKAAKCGDSSCMPALAAVNTLDSGNLVGLFTSITLGIDGFPVISYLDFTGSNVKVAKCGDASCTAASTILNTAGSSVSVVGMRTSITIGMDGLPVVSYFDSADGCLKVAKCGDAACASVTRNTVDSGAVVGKYSSITTGMDGLPVISYYDEDNGDLKVAKCANPFCLNNWSRR